MPLLSPFRLCALAALTASLVACDPAAETASTTDAPPPTGGDAPAPNDASPPTGGAPAPMDADAAPPTNDAAPQTNDAAPQTNDAAPPSGPALEALLPVAAEAICARLTDCCDGASRTTYLTALTENDRQMDLRAALLDPALSPEACAAGVAEALERVPFGAWRQAVNDGLVRYDPAAAQTCLDTLNAAQCGGELARALFDPACFWTGPPLGGPQQRDVFVRDAQPGTACLALSDGFGGLYFGTCDPAVAFCCGGGDPAACRLPQGVGSAGVCAPASQVGEPCRDLPPILPCATGLDCDANGTCQAPATSPLALGAPCMDAAYNLLGTCADSYCDVFGTRVCEPLRANGASCTSYEECASGACPGGACGPDPFCVAP